MRVGKSLVEQKVVSEIRDLLKEKDFRLTPQREAILVILLNNDHDHMTAEDIYGITRERNPEIGLATVYRTLELFEGLGVISRLDFGEGGRKYEYSGDREKHYHHHLLCLDCGEIIEFNEDFLDDLEERIATQSNFKIVDHSLRFYGYCAKCRDGNNEG
ncbi:MAG: Fur family transcriptional regulator ferric uptake regulator [Bacillota bacterium]|nr:MAG: Fur family transcriptional regulator ferric uptake regulator [Bacillota bacterium]MBS3950013.1 transcriptional repressor [Peptococcaceae bacterium]